MKNLIALKNTRKQSDNQPDYRLSAIDENGNFVNVGAFWKRKDKQGNPMLTGKLQDPSEQREGYYLKSEGKLQPEPETDEEPPAEAFDDL